MDYQAVTNFINQAKKFGSRLDLSRITKLCTLLGNPERKCRFVHVAGTNGKGSTSVYIENILMQAGYKTGLYTSPFIYEFNERIQINNTPIPDEALQNCMEQIVDATEQMIKDGDEHPTEFELITAAAFLYFAQEACDVVVLEVGLGGILDATNVIENPLVSVLVSISHDHMEYLGNTLSEIAGNKCGIIKKGCPVVSYAYQEEEVLQVIRETAEKQGCGLTIPETESLQIEKTDLSGNRFSYGGVCYEMKLIGSFQIYNAITAISVAECMASHGFDISKEHIRAGLACAKWPARFEILHTSPIIIADGSHNADGMRAFVETAKKSLDGKKVVCVFGMLRDKEYEMCLKSLSEITDTVIVTEVDNPRKESVEQLRETAEKYMSVVYAEKNNKDAVARAIELSGKTDAVIALGSLYMMKNIKDAVEKLFPKKV